MASASAGVDVPGHIYTSTKQVLADYIVQLRTIRLGELLAKQRGEIQLLLLAQIAQWGADPTVAQQARALALLACPVAVSCNCNRQAAAARGQGCNETGLEEERTPANRGAGGAGGCADYDLLVEGGNVLCAHIRRALATWPLHAPQS
jgi:hypothetical protein